MNDSKFGLLDNTQQGQTDTLNFINEICVEHQRTTHYHIRHYLFDNVICMTPNARVTTVFHLIPLWPPCATSIGTAGDNARNERSV